ncbi:decaprenylphospho-beta-D-erythro-pentofuranosid-2-ulose 2-reductase [Acidiferrimicrobium sp. IK]|uniref:decaprenylphospho-beta-D-erythro-pentofuranosid- 2-ulose 2-reductase n=1 Tax=Acidiferrimicrobium sp. IK TaxID=2871700 RepID=UPI0021CB0444|nr:decaprenylphospho-beta-D-erythro-pentofuranosid-2-ulose 2-reductase [Acidiferrimicrobium sp. IK]MCU4185548.1 decaprenylphospho-beta-D-erythro-pentofuranosid-2-ulose 2-reductase [Acidiferrimicrobium sp. IK]
MKDALGAVQSVLVLGGASEIGVAIAAELAGPRHATVVLAGRHPDALDAAAAQVRSAGAGRVETLPFDAADTDSHEAFAEKAWALAGDFDVVVVAFGLLGDQAEAEAGGDSAVRVAQTNYVGAVSISLVVSRRLRAQGHGTLVVLSSVAGERVRRANFVYGSTKAGLDGFAQGLGDSLAGTGAGVLIVRPGFVTGRMTAGMDTAPMATTPEAVAKATASAIASGKELIWVPGTLRFVFAAFRHLPRPLWRRLPV